MPSACAVVLHLSASERNRLKTCSSSPSMPHRLVVRAKIVRLAAAGLTNVVIASQLGLEGRHRP
jgi:DNA-binding NarL/FixJ family response regulator